jgi:hypothetical protein
MLKGDKIMERINFTYWFEDDDGEEHMISCSKKDQHDEGIKDNEVCAMFAEFMRSIGFSEQNVWNYFRD